MDKILEQINSIEKHYSDYSNDFSEKVVAHNDLAGSHIETLKKIKASIADVKTLLVKEIAPLQQEFDTLSKSIIELKSKEQQILGSLVVKKTQLEDNIKSQELVLSENAIKIAKSESAVDSLRIERTTWLQEVSDVVAQKNQISSDIRALSNEMQILMKRKDVLDKSIGDLSNIQFELNKTISLRREDLSTMERRINELK